MALDYLFLSLAFLLLLVGIVGCIVPIIPGPPISWGGLWLLYLGEQNIHPKTGWMVATGIAVALVMVLDYVLPSWGTKKFGGTKAGIRGSNIGLVVGLFFGIPGILFGPFIGAFVGELTKDAQDLGKAFKSALGSFIGFLLGTGLKLVVCFWMLYIWIKILFSTW